MMNQKTEINRRIQKGWGLLALSLVVLVFAFFVKATPLAVYLTGRQVAALALVLAGVAVGQLIKYTLGSRDPQVIKKMLVNEKDERMNLIRAQAGYRAFQIGLGAAVLSLLYFSLQGAALAAAGLLNDTLWYVLVGQVLVTFAVFIIELVRSSNRI